MMDIVIAELKKLKRYGILIAGFIVTILAGLYAFAPALANDGVKKTYSLVMNNTLESNCIYFFPAMIVLIGGLIARREYTDDTLKNILTVPVTRRQLLMGKIVALFIMTVVFSVLSFLFGSALCFVMGLPDATLPIMTEWLPGSLQGMCFYLLLYFPLQFWRRFLLMPFMRVQLWGSFTDFWPHWNQLC